MSIQVSSKNIFLNTQKSGETGSEDSTNSRFKMCLNNIPLQTGDNQFSRLSLVNFNMYRNFYLINKFNNKFHLKYDKGGSTINKEFFLTIKDYADIGDIAAEFQTRLIESLATAPQNITMKNQTGFTPQPIPTYYKGDTGNGVLDLHLLTDSGGAHGITNMTIQCRQFNTATSSETDFGDSYALMGAKRIASDSDTSSSFLIDTAIATTQITIKGFYPMQRTTMPYVYLRANESVKNLESENYKAAQNLNNSTHIVSSTILAKIPVSNAFVTYTGDMSTPYYVDSNNRNIAEIQFTLTDQHNRDIQEAASLQTEKGNFSCELVLNYSVWNKSSSLPINNNIETNQVGFNINAGSK